MERKTALKINKAFSFYYSSKIISFGFPEIWVFIFYRDVFALLQYSYAFDNSFLIFELLLRATKVNSKYINF